MKFLTILKKHYEKVILGVVLLGLAGAAGVLPLRIAANRKMIEDAEKGPDLVPVTPIKPADLSTNLTLLERAKSPPELDLSEPHHLVNPVVWQKKTASGELIKNAVEGPASLSLRKTTPLYLVLSFAGVTGAGENLRYQMFVTREADPNKSVRGKIPKTVALNNRVDNVFTVREVVGPAENPTGLVVELLENSERVTLAKDQEYKRVAGYTADLKYDLENKSFTNKRPKDTIEFGGEKYNIVAINENEVTVAEIKSGKRTTVRSK